MKSITRLLVYAILAVSIPPLFAQGAPRFVLPAAYLYQRPETSSRLRYNANGWTVAPQINVTKWFGVGVSVGGAYANPMSNQTQLYSFLGGPVFTLAFPGHKTLVPFTFANAGEAMNRVNKGPAAGGWKVNNSIEVLYGAGLDYRSTRHLGFRLFEVDNAVTFFNNATQYTPVISSGIVFKCGRFR